MLSCDYDLLSDPIPVHLCHETTRSANNTQQEFILRSFSASPVAGAEVSYFITSGDPHSYMAIDSKTGQIRTAKTLDHETDPTLLLSVQAKSGSPPSFLTAQVGSVAVFSVMAWTVVLLGHVMGEFLILKM